MPMVHSYSLKGNFARTITLLTRYVHTLTLVLATCVMFVKLVFLASEAKYEDAYTYLYVAE